jgi:hypothetical protein
VNIHPKGYPWQKAIVAADERNTCGATPDYVELFGLSFPSPKSVFAAFAAFLC